MNTLTKNRILAPGDEYRDGDKWKAVPKEDIGLQIMFTKYVEVRRPNETCNPANGAVGTPAPQERSPAPCAPVDRKVESKPTAPPKEYPKPKPLTPVKPLARPENKRAKVDEWNSKAKTLPTVISKKAHKHLVMPPPKRLLISRPYRGLLPDPDPADRDTVPKHIIERVLRTKPVTFVGANEITIHYPDPATPKGMRQPIWTGRNGTFKAKALNMFAGTGASEGIIKLVPEGARGMARNAVIEFPASIIPQVTDWLLRHQPDPKPTK